MLMAHQLEIAVKQTQLTVKAAIEGDLSARIPIGGKTGEIEALCTRRQRDARQHRGRSCGA